jgi:hypothetical protein
MTQRLEEGTFAGFKPLAEDAAALAQPGGWISPACEPIIHRAPDGPALQTMPERGSTTHGCRGILLFTMQ